MGRLFFLAAVFLGACQAHAETSAVSPGDGFEVERYAVSLRPDLASTAVAGTETIVVRATSDRVARLTFTPNALRITAATVNGEPVKVFKSDRALTFVLPRTLRRGRKATLRVRLDGTPARGVTSTAGGLYASYFACDWMVCLQDAPGDKADLALDLLLPVGATALGVGRALPVAAAPDGLALHRWRSTRPMSPYLYAFAAGPFVRRSVVTAQGELIYLDGTGTNADLLTLFSQAPAMAAFLSDKAGTKLPDGRYVQLFVPGREAQESASFSLIGKGELDAERDDPSSAWIIVHEMAHQWWGNLVTCATWKDFWLNEGMATFMVAAWKEHSSGEAAYQRELDVGRRRVARLREIGFDKPLTWDGKYPSLGVRRAVHYSKGALFLAHLRESIGDDAFWGGLRSFTRRHAGGTVTSKDFQNAMELASGRDLAQPFDQWVYGEG